MRCIEVVEIVTEYLERALRAPRRNDGSRSTSQSARAARPTSRRCARPSPRLALSTAGRPAGSTRSWRPSARATRASGGPERGRAASTAATELRPDPRRAAPRRRGAGRAGAEAAKRDRPDADARRLRHAAVRVRGGANPGPGRRHRARARAGRRRAPDRARVHRRRRRSCSGRSCCRTDVPVDAGRHSGSTPPAPPHLRTSTRSPPRFSARFRDGLPGERRAVADHPLARALRRRASRRARRTRDQRANFGASPGDDRPRGAVPLRRPVDRRRRKASSGTRPASRAPSWATPELIGSKRPAPHGPRLPSDPFEAALANLKRGQAPLTLGLAGVRGSGEDLGRGRPRRQRLRQLPP